MKEFENLVYLDLQKTGSTTIKAVLDNLLEGSENLPRPHRALPERFDRSKLFFISVREPLSLYISLFNFGAGNRRGSLFSNLRRKGFDDLFKPSYEAFEDWLRFVLDPKNAKALKKEFGHSTMAETFGLLSYRLLYLSVPNSTKRMCSGKFRKPDAVRELFGRRVYEDYVRTENLGGDLFAFLSHHSGRLKFRQPLTTAEDMIATVPVKNPSRKVTGLTPASVSPELRQLVREREWLIYEAFGYDNNPKGRPPRCVLPPADAGSAETWAAIGSRPPRGEHKAVRKASRLQRYQARQAKKAQEAATRP